MSDPAYLPKDNREFLLIQYRESYSHYRHLETLRSTYLAAFFTINTLAFSLINRSTVRTGLHPTNYPTTSVIFFLDMAAFLFYVITRINERATNSHLKILESIQKDFGVDNIINVQFQKNLAIKSTNLFLFLRKVKLASTATLFPLIYLIMMLSYLVISVLGLQHINFQNIRRYSATLCAIAACGVILSVCWKDFFQYFYKEPPKIGDPASHSTATK